MKYDDTFTHNYLSNNGSSSLVAVHFALNYPVNIVSMGKMQFLQNMLNIGNLPMMHRKLSQQSEFPPST